MVVSIECTPPAEATDDDELLQVLIHSKKGWERDTVSRASAEECGGELEALRQKRPHLESVSFTPRIDDGLKERLVRYEQLMISLCHKFGVLYSTGGQTEELQIYNNEHASPAFEDFLEFLGSKVELQGFTGYSGGLDTKINTTGTHSIYTRFGEAEEREIMFHPLTYLPYSAADPQQIERKRHIGNDVVVVVFCEANNGAPFSSSSIQSQLNHVFVIVSPENVDGETCYRVAISRKEGIPPFGPALPQSAVIKQNEEGRQWLLTKLINAERAAFRSPNFQHKFENVRKFQLQYILQGAKLPDEWEHTLLLLQQLTKFTRQQLEHMQGQLETALNGRSDDGDDTTARRQRLTAAEFQQIFTHLCPSWKGRENEPAVRRLFDDAKLNGARDRGLHFVDFARLLDALAFGSVDRRLGLLRRALLAAAAHGEPGEREGGGLLEAIVPVDLLNDAPRLSFSEFKARAESDAALVDLFTVEVPDEGRGQLSIVPNGFQGRRPSWWTEVVRAAAAAATGEHHVSGEDAQPGDWCVLF